MREITEAYEFDSIKSAWAQMKQTGDVPKTRDDHSLCQIDDSSFFVFGGFVAGSRVHESYVCSKSGMTLNWKKCGTNSKTHPSVRASHSSAHHNGKIYIFGGQDDDNNKLCDLWEFDLATD